MKPSAKEFAFRGLLASHAITELRLRGILRAPASTAEEVREHDFYAAVPEAIRSGSQEMQRFYRMLFVFENLIRDFVSQRLSDLDGDTWFDSRATKAMKDKVEDRKEKERARGPERTPGLLSGFR
jgi:hypothetical protein